MISNKKQRFHLIAVGGAVMHNVAIDLSDMGHHVTGSDDEIYEPSRSRLSERGLLPEEMGWNEARIDTSIDCIILGKHATIDNVELRKAQALDIPILSFPEFINQSSQASKRVAIAGSHGKTSTTSMIMHVLSDQGMAFDYLVGAQIKGFDKMVKLSDADILIVEADEYPSSCIDMRAKMLHYKPSLSVITGVAWDHVNIYKTYDSYKNVFREFLKQMEESAVCFFDQTDAELLAMMLYEQYPSKREGYTPYPSNQKGELLEEDRRVPIKIFGEHNLLNLQAAQLVCEQLGVSREDFLDSIQNFEGAAKRLELIYDSEAIKVYKDFAHAPSKCAATVKAVRAKYPNKKIRAVMELHTFSSLSADFIKMYAHSLDGLDHVSVFYDPHAIAMKKMEPLSKSLVYDAFATEGLVVIDDSEELSSYIHQMTDDKDEILLIMSSGNLGGFDLNLFVDSLN